MEVYGLILIFLFSLSEQAAYQYEFHFEDENIFEPCNKYPNNFIDQHFDISELSFNAIEDGKVHIKGKVISKVDWNNFKITVDIYKKIRGTWQPTVFSIKRNNLCLFIEDSKDLIYSFTKHLEELRCPFVAGKVYNLDYLADVGFSFRDPNLEGLYRADIKMTNAEDEDDFACMKADVYSYRK